MGRHLNPLEKEFLIRQYKSNPRLNSTFAHSPDASALLMSPCFTPREK